MAEILTVQEVCDYLRIAKPTLYRYVRSNDLPGFKMGKMWKFHRSSIDKWVQEKVEEDVKSRGKAIANTKKAAEKTKNKKSK